MFALVSECELVQTIAYQPGNLLQQKFDQHVHSQQNNKLC